MLVDVIAAIIFIIVWLAIGGLAALAIILNAEALEEMLSERRRRRPIG